MSWERVIDDFSQIGDRNRLDVVISMEADGTGHDAGANITSFNDLGFPLSARITLGRGDNTGGDAKGNGGRYFLDPTPLDHSEFTGPIVNAFAGNASADPRRERQPGAEPRLRPVRPVHPVSLEVAHAVGLFNDEAHFQDPDFGRLVNTGIADDAEGGGVGSYFVFDGPSVTHLMTSNNGGSGGSDIMEAVQHRRTRRRGRPSLSTPIPGAAGSCSAPRRGNAIYEQSRHASPTDGMALILEDANSYRYHLAPDVRHVLRRPEPDHDGDLLVRGGTGDSVDAVTLSRSGGDLVVSVDVGTDVPGTGPNGATGRPLRPSSDASAFTSVTSVTVELAAGTTY